MATEKKSKNNKEKKNVYAGTGISRNDDSYKAGKEAVEMAIRSMEKQGSTKGPDFGFVFCSGGKYGTDDKTIQKLVDGAHEALIGANPKCKWVGGTTCGELSNYGFDRESCVAMVLSSAYIHFGIGIGKGLVKTPERAGQVAAQQALADIQMDRFVDPYLQFTAMKKKNIEEIIKLRPYMFITLFPGSGRSYLPQDDLILKGITSVIGVSPLVGGSTADDAKFIQSYVFANGQVLNDAFAFVGMIFNLKAGIGIKHGYTPTKNIFTVTKASYKEVHELNGKPAAQVYAEATNTPLEQLKKNIVPTTVAQPIGITDIQGNYWCNCPFKATEDNKLLFLSPIKEGTSLCVMKGDKKEVIAASAEAIKESLKNTNSDIKDIEALIIFSCGARVFFLQNDIVGEYQTVKKLVGEKPFIGFYTYGEQGQIPNGPIGQHNQTFLCLSITNKLITE